MMKYSTVYQRISDRFSKFQIWLWLILFLAFAVCLIISLLHFSQIQSLNQTIQSLDSLRYARIDLANGFLTLAFAGHDSLPFNSREGLVLIDQALDSFSVAAGQLDSIASLETNFRSNIEAFRLVLETLPISEHLSAEQLTSLRIDYDILINQAEELDAASRLQLLEESQNLTKIFIGTITVAVLSFTGIALGVYFSGRSEKTAVFEREVTQRELEALYNATSALFRATSIPVLAHRIVEAVVKEFEQVDCGLLLVDEESKLITRLRRMGDYKIHPTTPLEIDGNGLVPKAIRSRELVYAPDVQREENYIPSVSNTRSELVIPLLTDDKVVAVLDLQSSELDAFSKRNQRLLMAYAERATIALENIRLYEAIQHHADGLEQGIAERTEELQNSKEQIELILNSSPDGILLLNNSLHIRQCNKAFAELFAVADTDCFNTPLSSYFPAESIPLLGKALAATRQAAQSQSIEITAKRRSEESFDAELSISMAGNDDFVCIIRDITKRKQADAALEAKMEEEQEFQSYLKGLNEISIILTQTDDLEEFYRHVIELGRKHLGFERLGLFLYNVEKGLAIGTFGTDMQGQTTDERALAFRPSPSGLMRTAAQRSERFAYKESVNLSTHMHPSGTGWNAAAVLWNGAESLGWLVADNAISHKAATKPLLEILSLYALNLGTLLATKRTALDLRASEARYRLLAENVNDVILKSNLEGNLTFITPSCYTLLGYTVEEMLSDPQPRLMHPDDANAIQERLAEARRQSETNLTLIHRARHKDGHYIWVEIRETLLYSPETGELLEYLGVIRDISERKNAEETLERYVEEIRDLYNNAPAGYHSLNSDGVFVQINDTELEWLGYSREELLGKLKFTDLLTPDSRTNFYQNYPRFKEQGWISDLEFDFIRKDGSLLHVLVNATAIYDDKGEYIRSRTTLYDMTELKKAQDTLKRQEVLLRTMLEVLPVGVWLTDESGVFIHANPAAQNIWRGAEYVGPDDYAVYKGWWLKTGKLIEADEWASARAIQQGETSINEEIEIECFDGSHKFILNSAIPMKIDNKISGVVIVNHDITPIKESEARLREALAKEKELGELKTRFVSMASHEFRTPLASILAVTETLSVYWDKLSHDSITERFEKIKLHIKYLQDIMDDVLFLAKVQARKLEYNPSVGNLDAFCRSILEEFRERPEIEHQLLYLSETQPYSVMLDPKLMRQIIANLLTNAIKYSPSSTPITISLARSRTHCLLTVADKGIGIPDADLKHLFEPFHRAANVGAVSGTGLGLLIIKEAVELHGGTIEIESQVGLGTTIKIWFPAVSETHDEDSSD
jgi:PAS domain S-box-containing protein